MSWPVFWVHRASMRPYVDEPEALQAQRTPSNTQAQRCLPSTGHVPDNVLGVLVLCCCEQITTNLVTQNYTHPSSYSSVGQKSDPSRTGLKSRCWKTDSFLESLGENLFPCFSAFQRQPTFLGSWPLPPSEPSSHVLLWLSCCRRPL